LGEEPKIKICATGTTGSGRYVVADFIGADVVSNEISAQLRAAVKISFIFPIDAY
jgi:activator of 2-hydroxyglutaryl-CoA dehydratase